MSDSAGTPSAFSPEAGDANGKAGAPRPSLLRRNSRVLGAGVLVVAGILIGVLAAVLLLNRSTLAAPDPSGGRAPAAVVPGAFTPVTNGGQAVPIAEHIPPVEVAIPVIGVRSSLVGLRLANDGTLQVPTDYAQAGWYSDGPAPADVGQPAVIVGHVDSTAGPAVFYRLRELKNGDPILVRRADGTSVRFVVYRSAQYPKSNFPAQQIYGSQPDAELRLITCTGDFDRATGHYLGNYVVYAKQSPVS